MLSRIMFKNRRTNNTRTTRKCIKYEAMLAQEADRFEDMFSAVKRLILLKKPLNQEEQNLVCVAYKENIRAKRHAWRVIISKQEYELENVKKSKKKLKVIREYRSKLYLEYSTFCAEMEYLLNSYLMSSTKDTRALVLYNRLKADNYRYMTEVSDTEEFHKYVILSKITYEKAIHLAEEHLDASDSYRLGVVLNFSVFYSDVCKCQLSAFNLVKNAAFEVLNSDEPINDESLLIIKLLNKNFDIAYLEQICHLNNSE